MLKPRNYRYKGVDPGREKKTFWIALVIAIAIMALLYYFF